MVFVTTYGQLETVSLCEYPNFASEAYEYGLLLSKIFLVNYVLDFLLFHSISYRKPRDLFWCQLYFFSKFTTSFIQLLFQFKKFNQTIIGGTLHLNISQNLETILDLNLL